MSTADFGMMQSAVINGALTGDNTLIFGTPGKGILIWKLILVVGAVTNITFKDGIAGVISGPIPMVANGSITLPFDQIPWFKIGIGAAFVSNSSGTTVQQSGLVLYSLSPTP